MKWRPIWALVLAVGVLAILYETLRPDARLALPAALLVVVGLVGCFDYEEER